MKYEWRKQEKALYSAKEQPALLTVPRQNYIAIQGKGNPNDEDFSQRVGVLYSLAYQVKAKFKAACADDPLKYAKTGFQDYTVFPLEGLWTSSSANPMDKDCYIYTIMIKQPAGITMEHFETAFELTVVKKPHPLLKEAYFETIDDGAYVQILHKGPFDGEPASFAKMDQFAISSGYTRLNHWHWEIYLTDPRKTAPEKRKTILRYQIRKDS